MQKRAAEEASGISRTPTERAVEVLHNDKDVAIPLKREVDGGNAHRACAGRAGGYGGGDEVLRLCLAPLGEAAVLSPAVARALWDMSTAAVR